MRPRGGDHFAAAERPAHRQDGRRAQAQQAGQAHRDRGPDDVGHGPAGQDAEALGGKQTRLRQAKRPGAAFRRQDLHERRGGRELVGAARAGQCPRASTTQGGSKALPISGAQEAMASQPIIRSRPDGGTSRPKANAPATVPSGMAAISSPTVRASPCSECAYGAARPSGTIQKPASQPKSSSVRSTGWPNTVARPARDTAHSDGRFPGSRSGDGRGLTQPATMTADRANDKASVARVRYGSVSPRPPPRRQSQGSGWPGSRCSRSPSRRRRCPRAARQAAARTGPRRTAPQQHGDEQQSAQSREWHARDRHQRDEPGPDDVADDHHAAPRKQVGQPGQQRAARDRRQIGQRVRQRRQEGRAGPVVHQHRDGNLRELIPGVGQDLRGPQAAEFADREDFPV